MSGEVKTYRLNDPMLWDEFKELPDDIKIMYIKALRERFCVPDAKIAEMLRIPQQTFARYVKVLGLCNGKGRGKRSEWDKDGWFSWVSGIPTPAISDEPVAGENALASCEVISDPVSVLEIKTLPVRGEAMKPRQIIPVSGNMTFNGKIEDVLETASVLLGGAVVHIEITWQVLPQDGECEPCLVQR